MVVQFLFRKPAAFFSIEKVFLVVMEELAEKITVRKFFVPFISQSIGNVVRNIRSVKGQKADLYHVTGDVHYIVFGLPRNKTILTIHDCVFLYRYTGIKKWFMHGLFLKWPVAWCRQITTISESTKQDIIKYSGCRPEKITVIPNPVSKLINYKPHQFRKQEPVLLFIGTTPNKNLERVAAALEAIPCILDIIGQLTPEMEALLAKHNIQYRNAVNLPEEELAAKYTDADVVLFPSLFEGFGLPIIEGQKAGRVVITSNLSPMKEVAADGACLADPTSATSIRDCVLKVISDDAYREQLIQKGWLNIKKYEPAYISNQYLQLYNKFSSQQ
jgi:glycosyltransferase involved in cell wall biosynthesis